MMTKAILSGVHTDMYAFLKCVHNSSITVLFTPKSRLKTLLIWLQTLLVS